MTESGDTSAQVLEELRSAKSRIEDGYKAAVSGLESEQEKLIARVRERFDVLRKEVETWRDESEKYLERLMEMVKTEDTNDQIVERIMSDATELRGTLKFACAVTVPDGGKIALDALALDAKPLSVLLDEQLPGSSFWSHKLYLIDATLSSLQIINLKRMEISHAPLKNAGALIANSVYIVLSTAQLFVCGGGHFGVPAKDCFLIDLKTYEVTAIPPMAVARVNPGVIESDGLVYVFGGDSGLWQEGKITSCEEFDLTTRIWRFIPEMSLAKNFLTPVHYKNRILLAGGDVNQIEAYLPEESHYDSFYAGYIDQVLMAVSFADEEFFYTLRKNKLYVHQFNSDFDQLPEVQMVDIPYNIWLSRTHPVRIGRKFYIAIRDELWSFDASAVALHKELTLS